MSQRTEEMRTYRVGDVLPAVTKTITQAKIKRYAEASGDHSPLHLDPAFATTTQFGGTIAHGMLVLAYVSEMMTAAFDQARLKGGRFKERVRRGHRRGERVAHSARNVSDHAGKVLCYV